MSATAEEVRDKALELPIAERLALAQKLFESCDAELTEDEVGELWGKEIERRLEAVERSAAVLVSFEEAMSRAEAVLAARRSS